MTAPTKKCSIARNRLTVNIAHMAGCFLFANAVSPASCDEISITKAAEALASDCDILISQGLELSEYRELCLSLIMPKGNPPSQQENEMALLSLKNTALAEDYPKGLKSYYKILQASDETLHQRLLIFTAEDKLHLFHSTTQRHPETPDSIDFDPLGLEGSRWLMFARITDPLDSPQCAFRFELTDDVYGVYRILEDNTLSRIGEDADAVFDDLVALKTAHAAGTLKDAPPALKTNFAKALLARLLEQAAQPDQGNSERSEVGRQAAE